MPDYFPKLLYYFTYPPPRYKSISCSSKYLIVVLLCISLMHICHIYTLSGVSVQIIFPNEKQVISLLLTFWSSFHNLDTNVLFLIWMKSNLFIFFFPEVVLLVLYLRNLCLTQGHKDILLYFLVKAANSKFYI